MYVFFKIPVKTYRQCLRVYRGMEKKKKKQSKPKNASEVLFT